MKLPQAEVVTEYLKFEGGIDRVSPALSVKPGNALDAMNYEPRVEGGFRRVDGYERFDGRAAPSAATYYYMLVTFSGTALVGQCVKGGTSGATGIVAVVGATYLILTRVSGTFTLGETLTAGGGSLPLLLTMTYTATTVGTVGAVAVLGGQSTVYDDAVALNASADIYRAAIGVVPGSGQVRGVQIYKGTVYAFRNNQAGTACLMWKSTANGWQFVPLGRELSFTSGGTYQIAEGNTITGETSGATAVVTRVVLQSGTWAGGNAAGRLIFASQTGTFQAENIKVGTNTNVATIAGNASAITLSASGAYEIITHNFSGSSDTLRMYGADGVNRGFESDGSVFVPIATGMATDTPAHVAAHKKMLFLSFRGSSQNSGITAPYQWTAVTGATEIGIGDTITAYAPQTGGVLAIFARNRCEQLSGSSTSDFVLDSLSERAGAISGTAQILGATYCLDDQGIRQIRRTQDFGNFQDFTVSEKVQPLVDDMRAVAVASSVYRHRSQYRLYGSDGTGLILVAKGDKVVGITQFEYPISVTCACSGEDATGKDVVFLGASNGYVYQCDKGTSFDGEEIEAFLRLPFNHSKTPRVRKRYRKAVIEMESEGYSAIRFSPEFSYGDDDAAAHRTQTATAVGPGGYYDSGSYDEIIYDGQIVQSPEFSIEGTGTNIGLLFYSKSDIDAGHVLHGVLMHYTPRRNAR